MADAIKLSASIGFGIQIQFFPLACGNEPVRFIISKRPVLFHYSEKSSQIQVGRVRERGQVRIARLTSLSLVFSQDRTHAYAKWVYRLKLALIAQPSLSHLCKFGLPAYGLGSITLAYFTTSGLKPCFSYMRRARGLPANTYNVSK